jgi:TetR/AcrR family transcriptional regulator, transcriptional repressor of bet genes
MADRAARARGTAPRFHRASPQVRRAALVEATLDCLRRYGRDGASARRISAHAGVSVGLINHYYPGKAALVAAAYDSLASSLLDAIRRHALAVKVDPRERLRRFFQASFSPEHIDPELFNVWLVFWSMVGHAAEMRRVHDRTYGATRATLETLLGDLRRLPGVPAFRLRPAAIGLAALLDGLWIEASLNPTTFRPTDAVALCTDWVDALTNGALPGLRRSHHA